jgi:hypothetical protein
MLMELEFLFKQSPFVFHPTARLPACLPSCRDEFAAAAAVNKLSLLQQISCHGLAAATGVFTRHDGWRRAPLSIQKCGAGRQTHELEIIFKFHKNSLHLCTKNQARGDKSLRRQQNHCQDHQQSQHNQQHLSS